MRFGKENRNDCPRRRQTQTAFNANVLFAGFGDIFAFGATLPLAKFRTTSVSFSVRFVEAIAWLGVRLSGAGKVAHKGQKLSHYYCAILIFIINFAN